MAKTVSVIEVDVFAKEYARILLLKQQEVKAECTAKAIPTRRGDHHRKQPELQTLLLDHFVSIHVRVVPESALGNETLTLDKQTETPRDWAELKSPLAPHESAPRRKRPQTFPPIFSPPEASPAVVPVVSSADAHEKPTQDSPAQVSIPSAKRRRKSMGLRNKAKRRNQAKQRLDKSLAEAAGEAVDSFPLGSTVFSEVRKQRIQDAQSIADMLRPSVRALAWGDVKDETGTVVSLGRRSWSMYAMATYTAAGFDVGPASAVATALFGTSERTLKRQWSGFLGSDENFLVSQRGKHAKYQWALDNVDTMLECREWLDEHSNMKGDDRSSPASFSKYLSSRADEILARVDGKRLGLAVAPAKTRTAAEQKAVVVDAIQANSFTLLSASLPAAR